MPGVPGDCVQHLAPALRAGTLDPTARAGCDQACGLLPSDVLAGQRRDYGTRSLQSNLVSESESHLLKPLCKFKA